MIVKCKCAQNGLYYRSEHVLGCPEHPGPLITWGYTAPEKRPGTVIQTRRHGFVPTSLIYDGCLVSHNPDGDIEVALREAEAAVASALGFEGLKLKEKDMYHLAEFTIAHLSRAAARQAALDAASGEADEVADAE